MKENSIEKILWILLGIFLGVTTVNAQKTDSKINIDLYKHWQKTLDNSNSFDEQVPVLVKGDIEQIQHLTKISGGHFKYNVGNIASVYIALNRLEDWLQDPAIYRMESDRQQGRYLYEEDTLMLSNNNVYPVHQGTEVLPQAYQGEGVIIGVIDGGYEWQHPDFQNFADSSTRILHLWDQTAANANYFEHFYAYGASWTKADIDQSSCTQIPGNHGSHVLGIAAGNGQAANKYVGVAPRADIVAVSLDKQSFFLHHFVDAVHYIFEKADELEQPCAINSSVGTYNGAHDGRDLFTAIIDSMLNAKTGRALIQAAGNARQYALHWQADLRGIEDTARLWFDYTQSISPTTTTLYADTGALEQLAFSFELIASSDYHTKGASRSYNLERDVQWSSLSGVGVLRDTLFWIGGSPFILEWIVSSFNGTYALNISLSGNMLNRDYWQMTVSGIGKVDLWSDPHLLNNTKIVENSSINHYQKPDNEQTLAGYWTCSDQVVTVTAYQNRSNLHNYLNDTVSLAYAGYPVFGIADFSSLGPTRDGRQKPDLTAPGGQVLSAQPLGTLQYYKDNQHIYLDAAGWHASGKGTSMAAPMVTGAIALYFQCQPHATWEQLKLALENTSRIDSFVIKESAYIPNYHWGYGKLDVYELMKSCMIYGCTDSLAPNYNPNAHFEDGSCEHISTRTQLEKASYDLYPNPSHGQFVLKIPSKSGHTSNDLEVKIYDLIGREVKAWQLLGGQPEYTLNVENLHPAEYFLIVSDQKHEIMYVDRLIIVVR